MSDGTTIEPELAANLIRRFSSRRQRIDHSFLNARIKGAKAYDRIAGYFCGSILECAGEALESVQGTIRVVCNSGVQPQDVVTARAAAAALRQEWCASKPEELVDAGGNAAKTRMSRLFQFLHSDKLQVKVLPDKHFGLIHGKAGVITLADGTKTAFLGSANESRAAWTMNYELLWEDDSPEAVVWVQEEFDALWTSPFAVPLAEFVIEDVQRLSHREVIPSVPEWVEEAKAKQEDPKPASVFVESPVYREQVGLWEHQKFFVKLAFDAHLHNPGGARFVLADQVGLGKTIQLAMAAELMVLVGDKPVLVLAPKTLLQQWQGELLDLLDMPSARWNGRQWIDENGIEYPAVGPEGIRKCPRRVGIVSTGLVTAESETAKLLKTVNYECVILDEAHRARRRNLGPDCEDEKSEPNNLLRFMHEISTRTKSMLLATATPVQIHPIEAWDLLDALSRGSEEVLGNNFSKWRRPAECLPLVMGRIPLPTDDIEIWEWVRTPMPPKHEHRDFEMLRRNLEMPDEQVTAKGSDWERLSEANRSRLRQMFPRFVPQHNPFIRHIVRRSRDYLENTLDPETNEPYLKRIEVRLWGEADDDAIRLPPYLKEAYEIAEQFCKALGQRMKGAGFLKTLLLRRVGSTVVAGRITAERMLGTWQHIEETEEDDDESIGDGAPLDGMSRTLTAFERELLERFVQSLQANQERDPKYGYVKDALLARHWLERGCIVFSQYFDSVRWLAEQLALDIPDEPVGIYAGAGKSGIWSAGRFKAASRDEVKLLVRKGELRLLIGTDAASEGLNLQRLGTLINLDLPWNPTRLEQRKGRIQRIGQLNDAVDIYNMRYRDSVEDRVHQLLSTRLQEIHTLFGQIPDVLEDVWIDVALGEEERAEQLIKAVPTQHPFDVRYERIQKVDWESCAKVLSAAAKHEVLRQTW
jgi:hypothetical protein